MTDNSKKQELPDDEWRKRLDPEAYQVLRHEGTEYAGTSPLNEEKRSGTYVCAGCDTPLFKSEMKFNSSRIVLFTRYVA